MESNCTVVNHYGPTETTIGKLLHIVKDGYPYQENIPVGKPFSNTTVYVVNASGQLCPVGVPGELLIGGDGVAAGYLNNTELSAEKFINDPFSDTSGIRFYRTGDTVKYLADGNILFIGRVDDQVKIRGYRIELGEIESALAGCIEHVHQAVVLARPDDAGNKRLVGYIVPKGDYNKDAIVAYLKNRLPDYMIPLLFVELKKIPLTANGKVDKRGLPEPDVNSLLTNDYVAPRNETENTLIAIWQEVLRLDKIGVHDNFFELGGDSIITIQVVSRSRRSGYVLSPKDIFTCQTVARLSAQLAVQESNKVNAEQETLSGTSGLLPIQQKFLNGVNPVNHSFYNHHITYAVNKDVAIEALTGAVADLAGYHDAIRFAYQQTAAGWEQVYTDQAAVLDIVDLQKYDEEQFSLALAEHAASYQESLDLEKGILFRAVLFLSPMAEHQLLFIIHHLAVDGVSWRILSDDLELLLQHPGQPAATVLGPKTSSYRQWYTALAAYGNSRGLQRQQDYWEQTVNAYVPLKTDHKQEEPVRISDMDTAMVQLDSLATGKLLHEVSSVYHTEINDLLLSALALTLADWNKTSKVSIGLEGHGREEITEEIDTSRTVGWFTTIYPVLLETGNEYGQLIKQVKETLRQIPDKGLGYGVLKYINQHQPLQANDPWDVQFNYLGQGGAGKLRGKLAHPKWETFGSAIGDQTPVSQPLSVLGIIQDDKLALYWSYSNKHFNSESVEEMAAAYLKNLESLINHCTAQQQTNHYTPADFGLAGSVSIEELDQFLDLDFEGKPRRTQIESIYRLSGLQEGMLFHGIFDEQTSSSYVEQFSGELTDLDTDAFLQSWNYLLKQHAILRSGFYANTFAIPVQCVYREIEMPVTLVDYSDKTAKQQQKAIRDYEKADLKQGFDFTSAPLMRIFLMKLSETKYQLCWTYHHILVDGWSMSVLMGELLKAYELLLAGKQLPLPRADRYEDYIRYIESRDADKGEDYWRNYLANVSEGTLLPFISANTDRNKGGIGAYSTHHLVLDTETTSRLSGYAQRHRITMNTLVQGVWAYLLYRYTGRTEVTYGVTVSGRPDNLPGVEHAVGMYINTLPFHARMDELQAVTAWLQTIQGEQLESREYQHMALNEIQRRAGIPGDLFDSLLVYENYPSNPVTDQSLSLQVDHGRKEEHTNYPLSVAVMVAEEITVYFSYNTTLLAEEYMKVISGHFEQAITGMTSADNLLLKDIEILSAGEKQQLIHTFNDTAVAFPETNTIIDQFNAQVARTPNAPAFITDQVTMTYQELDQQAGRLANYLRDQGVGAETLVPLCLERSPEMVISIMAILKAGAAYVPIDPDYPQDRIRLCLKILLCCCHDQQQSGCRFITGRRASGNSAGCRMGTDQ
ncbi:condensation domain-containing protein [Pedobacter sp. NJ-S-72]